MGVLKNRPLAFQVPLNKEVTLLHPLPIQEAWDEATFIAANIRRGYLFMAPEKVMNDLNRAGYYMYPLGFFCQKELLIDKFARVPLRLRLGSLAEVNRLEGKPGW